MDLQQFSPLCHAASIKTEIGADWAFYSGVILSAEFAVASRDRHIKIDYDLSDVFTAGKWS